MIGAEAIRDSHAGGAGPGDWLSEQLRQEIAEATTELKPKKLAKRLKLVEAFIASGNGPNG